jgi:pimeloyl-ACP methyl ester carboxylesterase
MEVGAATLSVQLCGWVEAVVLIPSWARGADDFADLVAALVDAGFRTIAVIPRGVGESTGVASRMVAYRGGGAAGRQPCYPA